MAGGCVPVLKLGGDGEHAENGEHEASEEGDGLHWVERGCDGDGGPGDDEDRAARDAKPGHAAVLSVEGMAGAAAVVMRPPPLAPIAGGDCGARNWREDHRHDVAAPNAYIGGGHDPARTASPTWRALGLLMLRPPRVLGLRHRVREVREGQR